VVLVFFSQMFFIRLLIGPLSSLNLRNLLWHGFLVPPEFHASYASLMMLVYLSIADALRKWDYTPRPLIDLSGARYPNLPPSLHLFQGSLPSSSPSSWYHDLLISANNLFPRSMYM
jgi:hypothetical protein